MMVVLPQSIVMTYFHSFFIFCIYFLGTEGMKLYHGADGDETSHIPCKGSTRFATDFYWVQSIKSQKFSPKLIIPFWLTLMAAAFEDFPLNLYALDNLFPVKQLGWFNLIEITRFGF